MTEPTVPSTSDNRDSDLGSNRDNPHRMMCGWHFR
jgi:hypothetical protein